MNKLLIIAIILIIGISAFSGCFDKELGILEIYITDAQGDSQKRLIKIDCQYAKVK